MTTFKHYELEHALDLMVGPNKKKRDSVKLLAEKIRIDGFIGDEPREAVRVGMRTRLLDIKDIK